MFRALTRTIGCLGLLLVALSVAWATRARWLPRVGLARLAPAPVTWTAVTTEDAQRGRAALATLAGGAGTRQVTLAPAELVGASLDPLVAALERGARGGPVAVAVDGDALLLRVRFRVADLGDLGLGPLSGVGQADETLTIGGPLAVPRRGVGELRVTRLAVRDLDVPPPAVGAVAERLARLVRQRGFSDGSLAFPLPPTVSDVRVRGGRVTLRAEAR